MEIVKGDKEKIEVRDIRATGCANRAALVYENDTDN
jgi:hypothetical protein